MSKNIVSFIYLLFVFFIPFIAYSADMPKWILNPLKEGYSFCCTGFAKFETGINQKQTAKINCFLELSKSVNIEVNNKIERVNDNVTMVSDQNSSNIISNAEEIDIWIDSKKNMYLLMCIK